MAFVSPTRQIDGMKQSQAAGFTLIELVVVLVILGLLAGLVAPQIFGRVSEAKVTTARTQVDMLSAALDGYRLDAGTYPTTAQGLAALRSAPAQPPAPLTWRGPYLRREIPADPWGRPYVYLFPGTDGAAAFDLYSLGRDGRPGGEGEDADIGMDRARRR